MTIPFLISRRTALTSLLLPVLGTGIPGYAASAFSAPQSIYPDNSNRSSVLIAYLSRSGNTRVIAGQEQRAYGSDLFEIRTAKPYPEDYEEMVREANRQRLAREAPQLEKLVGNMAQYRTVFLGFPIWATALPAPVRSFLQSHDLEGKTIIPFITYGSSGPGNAPATVRELAEGAQVLEHFAIKRDQERDTLSSVSNWMAALPSGH